MVWKKTIGHLCVSSSSGNEFNDSKTKPKSRKFVSIAVRDVGQRKNDPK
jgi:hypothetical protein